jgi:hypothetical protein
MTYKLFTLQYPEEFDLLISSRTNNIRDKASADRMQQLDQLDTQLIDQLREIISQAVHEGTLNLPDNIKLDDICFGLWAMSFGMLALVQAEPLVKSLQPSEVDLLLISQIACLLDGYGWEPLSRNHNYNQSYKNILEFLSPAS